MNTDSMLTTVISVTINGSKRINTNANLDTSTNDLTSNNFNSTSIGKFSLTEPIIDNNNFRKSNHNNSNNFDYSK